VAKIFCYFFLFGEKKKITTFNLQIKTCLPAGRFLFFIVLCNVQIFLTTRRKNIVTGKPDKI